MDKKLFENIAGVKPLKSAFDLSYEYKTTCDMGELIPVYIDIMQPGDILDIGHQGFFRTQPLVAPLMHNIKICFHTFSVAFRHVFNEDLDGAGESFTDFITGGTDGASTASMPQWIPSTPATTAGEGTLWDYMGFPLGKDPDGSYPTDCLRRAYYKIWNDYYRDEQLQSELDISDETVNYVIKKRNRPKNYFTSARPSQQLGTAPSFPLSGTTAATWEAASFSSSAGTIGVGITTAGADAKFYGSNAQGATNIEDTLEDNTVDFSGAGTFDIADMRLQAKLQQWMELNSRAGARYKEFIQAHFGVHFPDNTAQRPEFIGSSTTDLIVSEVLQTESSDASTPQGNLAGHGIGINSGYIGRYKAVEFCIVMTLMSIMPKEGYQQGINRKWTYSSKYDFPFPEFMNLSEQAILRAELYATSTKSENETVFGYQGVYDELRINHDTVTNGFRSDAATSFDYWHLARNFSSAPLLNSSFIECDPRKDIFAAPSEPGFYCQIGNTVKMVRPMPYMATPGIEKI